MKKQVLPVYVGVEQWKIPTYPIPEAEEMPMFAETANHQGTTGNPYPMRVVSAADGEHRAEQEWTVIRLENEYIRLAICPPSEAAFSRHTIRSRGTIFSTVSTSLNLR